MMALPVASMPKVGRGIEPATISSPSWMWTPNGAARAPLPLLDQTSPLTDASARWPSRLLRLAIDDERSRPRTASLLSPASIVIPGAPGWTVTKFTTCWPLPVTMRPQVWLTPGPTGAWPSAGELLQDGALDGSSQLARHRTQRTEGAGKAKSSAVATRAVTTARARNALGGVCMGKYRVTCCAGEGRGHGTPASRSIPNAQNGFGNCGAL